jgi:hypothetical protein
MLLLVIICYITTIGDYCIINHCLIFLVIISWPISSYYIVGYLKLFFIGYYFFILSYFFLMSLYFILYYFELLYLG